MTALAPVLALLGWTAPAHAAAAFFPDAAPPPTQITRDLSLKEAAQRGLITLESKGLGGEGDAVSLTLEHKKVTGPITVSVRVEFTVTPKANPDFKEALGNDISALARRAEAWADKGYRTRDGDPISFKFDFVVREPDDPPRFNYHQVTFVNPEVDFDEPDPDYRTNVDHLPVPNSFGDQAIGTYTYSAVSARTLAHETLHMAGLDDRYTDFYRVKGRDYPLPETGLSGSKLKNYLRDHRPPLPPPPAGEVISKNTPGTERCDIMGTGMFDNCRKITRRDLDWLESQAGVQITARPGELLLNKDASRQNMGVGFETKVFAEPGRPRRREGSPSTASTRAASSRSPRGSTCSGRRGRCRAMRRWPRCSS